MIYGIITGIILSFILLILKDKFMGKKSVNNED